MDIPLPGFEIEKLSMDYLYARAKGKCFVCRFPVPREDATREHILPRSLGGGDDEDNLSISHSDCNHKRGNGYKSIYSKHHDLTAKHFVQLDKHGLLIQIVPDKYGGFYLVLGKKTAS